MDPHNVRRLTNDGFAALADIPIDDDDLPDDVRAQLTDILGRANDALTSLGVALDAYDEAVAAEAQ